jgi:hypothetical protein
MGRRKIELRGGATTHFLEAGGTWIPPEKGERAKDAAHNN